VKESREPRGRSETPLTVSTGSITTNISGERDEGRSLPNWVVHAFPSVTEFRNQYIRLPNSPEAKRAYEQLMPTRTRTARERHCL
jgi:hypothetical protein